MESINSITERIARDFIPPENPNTPSIAPENRFGLGDPSCPICGGIGFIIKDNDDSAPISGTIIPCQCRLKKFENNRKRNNTVISNIEGYEQMTFNTFNIEGKGQLYDVEKTILKIALDEAMAFAENPQKWLFFTGRYGTGKTHLAAAIANYCLSKGMPIIFQPVPDLLDELRTSYGNTNQSYEESIERIRKIPLLILDDLGAQNATDWAEEKLYQIFNYRYVNQLPTVITSNASLARIDGRIVSRLGDNNLTKIIKMNVPSYRTNQRVNDYEDNISTLDLLKDRTFENFDLRRQLNPDAQQKIKMAYDNCKAFASDTHGWLILAGPSGVGKMHLAAAVGNKCKKDGDQLFFVTASDLLDYLRTTYSPNSSITYDAVFDQIRKCELLILNYLDTMNATPWAKEKIYQIINYRYQAKLATMITLQKPIKDVDRNIQSRLIDKSLCTIVEMFEVPMYEKQSNPKEDLEKARRYKKKESL